MVETIGFVSNGPEFKFLKLTKQGKPKYAECYPFALQRGNDLCTIVSVLKHFAQLLGE